MCFKFVYRYRLLNVVIYIVIALDKFVDYHTCTRVTDVTSKFAADSSSLTFSYCPASTF